MKQSQPGSSESRRTFQPPRHVPRYFSAQISAARRFYLALDPALQRGLVVVSGGVEHCRPDYKIDRGGFPHPTIEFVARGAGQLVLNSQPHALTAGTVFVYGRAMPHRIITDPKAPLVKYFVVLAGQEASRLLCEWNLMPGRVAHTPHPEQIQHVFDDLIRHGLGDRSARARMCAVILHYLVMKIGDSVAPHPDEASGAYATYERCRRYIEENYERTRTLQEVAAACHVDLAYLCRLFQRFGRESPSLYLRHLRLNRAAELLHAGCLVKHAADELGFSESCNFTRAFTRFFGLPPGRVQRQ
ncbi:MAG: AraC family transcriptional regulator [Verrucomicrobiia bacterium]